MEQGTLGDDQLSEPKGPSVLSLSDGFISSNC